MIVCPVTIPHTIITSIVFTPRVFHWYLYRFGTKSYCSYASILMFSPLLFTTTHTAPVLIGISMEYCIRLVVFMSFSTPNLILIFLFGTTTILTPPFIIAWHYILSRISQLPLSKSLLILNSTLGNSTTLTLVFKCLIL